MSELLCIICGLLWDTEKYVRCPACTERLTGRRPKPKDQRAMSDSDVVTRLREIARFFVEGTKASELGLPDPRRNAHIELEQAAAELESLRAELSQERLSALSKDEEINDLKADLAQARKELADSLERDLKGDAIIMELTLDLDQARKERDELRALAVDVCWNYHPDHRNNLPVCVRKIWDIGNETEKRETNGR